MTKERHGKGSRNGSNTREASMSCISRSWLTALAVAFRMAHPHSKVQGVWELALILPVVRFDRNIHLYQFSVLYQRSALHFKGHWCC